MAREAAAALLAAAVALAPPPTSARDLTEDGRLSLRTTFKATVLVSRFQDDPVLFPEPTGAEALFHLRHDFLAALSERFGAGASWETQLGLAAPPAIATNGFLPPHTSPPFRIRPLDEPLLTADGLTWRHQLDRAWLAWRPGRSEVTVGRQAIGWGRGVLFGAVDLFAPFSPLAADRTWRGGVDAVRTELRFGERASVDAAAAFGHDADPDESIYAARLRGYAGDVDAELLLGRRARDLVVGAASSAAIGDAEAHAELALFRTPDANPDALLSDDRLVVKAVVGASYRLAFGQGVPVFLEYHYSGFGAARPGELPALLADPAFATRLARGDTQLTGRHAVALLATYEANERATFQLLWLASPRDGSGVVSPSATLAFGDHATVQATAWFPHGAAPRNGLPRSDFGATPVAVLVQVSVYD